MTKKSIIVFVFVLAIFNTNYGQIPSGYYQSAEGLNGSELKNALHNIIDNHQEYSYNALRDYILKNSDEDPNNGNNVILLYTGRSQAKSTFGGGANDWNREHVWAKSHGDFGNNAPAGTDAHHIRPTDASVNSERGNLDFDMGGNPVSEAPGCYRDGDSFEPRDAVKGDVARMIFYMATRYEGGSGEPDLEVVDYVNTSPNPKHGKLSQLILWNSQDPPDDFERNRNDVIYYQYQNNRNPFIDHPEYADAIWGDPNIIDVVDSVVDSVFPIPATEILNISLRTSKKCSFTIYSIIGNKIKEGIFESRMNSINIADFPTGVYYLLIESQESGQFEQITFIASSK
jgi:endonuclease I